MTIAEVSKKYDLSADTLRYYERIGLIPKVNRTNGGNRSYTDDDCRWVEFAKCMRGAGLPIEELTRYVALFQQGDSAKEARKNILVKQRNLLADKMKEIQKVLDRLDSKIEMYEQVLVPAEKGLKKSTD